MSKKLAAAALILCIFTGAAMAQFYTCSGTNVLAPDGSPFRIKGNALSHWLNPEAYALKLNLVHSRHLGSPKSIKTRIAEIIGSTDAQKFWNTYQSNFVTQADIADMKAEGFNTIRIPFNYRLISPEDQPGVYSEAGFQVLDQVIGWCKAQGLAVILDMHACPGGQSHDAPSDPEWSYWAWDNGISNWIEIGVACLWASNADYTAATGRTPEFNQQRTVDLWREIANRYKNETAILGYEPINEPFLPYGVHYPVLRDLLVRITAAIREVDTNHVLFLEGNYYAGSFEGLVPTWDSKTVLCFHRYWCSNTYASIQAFCTNAAAYDVPLCMTESGENSNPWFHDAARLLEGRNIGWCWWGYKKGDQITSVFSANITPDYQYVINNFRDLPIDAARARKGLMECATNLLTAKCDFDPGWYDALLSPSFNTASSAFMSHTLPCKIYAVNYDVGNAGVAYGDAISQNVSGWSGFAYNSGYAYRNDGVDMAATSEGNGFKVAWIEAGEWLAYSIQVSTAGKYDITFRSASPNSTGRIQLYLDGAALTSVISLPRTGGWETWRSTTVKGITLPAGAHRLEARFPGGGSDFASMEFKKAR